MAANPLVTIPLQVPTSTVKSAAALQESLNGSPYLFEYVMPGHPLITQFEFVTTAVQTNAVLLNAGGAGIRTAITMIAAFLSLGVTVNVPVRIGLVTGTLPPESMTGSAGIVLNHELAPGGGVVLGNGGSIIAISPANTTLRMTCGAPTGGKLVVLVSYFQPQIS